MRYRVKQQLAPLLYQEQLVGGPFSGLVVTGDYPGLWSGSALDEISDNVDPRLRAGSKRGRYGVSAKDHYTVRVKGFSIPQRSNYPWPGEVVNLLGDTRLGISTIPGVPTLSTLLRTLDPESTAMSTIAKEARLAFVDQMPQELSIPNFAVEAREVVSLVPSMLEFARSFSSSKAAGSYLAYEFGAAPFIGDLKKLYGLYTSVSKRIDHLRRTWGEETRLSHSKRDVVPLPVIRPWYELKTGNVGWLQPGFGYEAYELEHTTSVHFKARLTQRLEGLETLGGKLRAFAAATGFNNPLGVLWEAVPFSFVVDWVSNVGSLFDSVKAQPFQGEWRVYDVTHTTVSETRFQLRQRDLQGGWLLSDDVGRLTLRRVRRGLGFPERVVDLDFSSLSPKQLILSMALLRGIVSR